jgi:glycosyltransferase involved in cell wall biosynthesis
LIISNMAHHRRGEDVAGWGPTVQEIDQLATVFDEVRHIGCLYEGEGTAAFLPYRARNVTLVPVPPAGGTGLLDKLAITRLFPLYARTILRELPSADVVHVRCPCTIGLLAIMLLALVQRPRLRWAKYAGNWRPAGHDPWSYRVQRWWLQQGLHRGAATVNGQWPHQPAHVYSFLNPCLTSDELSAARPLVEQKQITSPVRLLFIGRVDGAKGVGRLMHVMARLRTLQVPATLDVVGDGPERRDFEALAGQQGVADLVRFHGWLPRTELTRVYGDAHLMVLPSSSEGWPKVLSEGMAYGVVPIASTVSSIPQYLERFRTGRALDPLDVEAFSQAIAWYAANPAAWKSESLAAASSAEAFSYPRYLAAVEDMLARERARTSAG